MVCYLRIAVTLVSRRPRELRLRRGASKPAFESRRADSRGGAGGYQGLIVQLSAEVASVNIGGDLACVVVVGQDATDKLVKSKFLGARYLKRVIAWRAEHEIGQGGDDIIRKDRLHQGRRDANRLSVAERIGDAAHELEELRGAQNRVGNSRGLDEAFLDHFCTEVPAIGQPVRADDRECHVMADRKSTRLNSSHRCTSYAVLCLKKKKQPR